jgi:hypothetical protein
MTRRIPTGIGAALDSEQIVTAGIKAETIGKAKVCPVATATGRSGRIACASVEKGTSLWVA